MNADDPSDDELVLRTKSGDAPAFAALSERHRANLVRMATLLVGDPDEAESIAQEALARAWPASPPMIPKLPSLPGFVESCSI